MSSSTNPERKDDNTQEYKFTTPPPTEKSEGKKRQSPESGEGSDKKKIRTRSEVWDHFTRQVNNENRCNCHYCKKSFACPTSQGTSNLKKHLETCKQYKAWDGRKTQRVINQEGQLKDAKISEDIFREATNEMLVLGELTLSFVDSMAWKHFCDKCNLYQPHSRRTATKDIIQMYVARKASLKSWIASSGRRVSLTTDIWVAQSTSASYMVITAHFVDAEWTLRKLIIGFKYITDHKSKTIAKILLECLADWGIEKLFCITVDNATANTCALKKFHEEFKLSRNDAFVLDGDYMHMRCCAHIINLIVKDGLQDLGDNVAAIRNGVQYVRSSGARCDSFEQKVVAGKMTRGSLPMDCKTRWNSTYLMLSRAAKYKMAFEKMKDEDKLYHDYFMEVENGRKRIGPPSISDWKAVERLTSFLELFYTATLIVFASANVCAYKCYGEIVTIEKNLQVMVMSNDREISSMALNMSHKFNKYWDGLKNINKMLIIASVLDPRKKMKFAKMCFEKIYGKDSVEAKQMYASVYAIMRSMFDEYNARSERSSTHSSQFHSPSKENESPSMQDQDHFDSAANEFGEELVSQFERMDAAFEEVVYANGEWEAMNELDIYLKDDLEKPKTMLGTEWNVLSWWRFNSQKFPILSEIARDVLAMQVSSVASESAFSTSGRMLEPHRSCLTHYMVEVLMCTEQWMKQDAKFAEKGCLTNSQILSEIELMDSLQKEFQAGVNLD